MSFSSISLDGHSLHVPDIHTGEDAEAALQSLVDAAVPAYNHALQHHRDSNVESALQAIHSAIRVAPYTARFVEFGCVLAIRHGAFEMAQELLSWGKEAGMAEEWPDYEGALHEAVARWNTFVSDIDSLRDHYRSAEADASYRELLLLADRLSESGVSPTEQEKAHLQEYSILPPSVREAPSDTVQEKPKSARDSKKKRESKRKTEDCSVNLSGAKEDSSPIIPRRWVTAGVAGLIGVLIGAGGMWRGEAMTGKPETSPSASTSDPVTENVSESVGRPHAVETLASAQLKLTQGTPLEAHRLVDTLTVAGPDANRIQTIRRAVQTVVHDRLYREGMAAWSDGEAARTVALLKPVARLDVGRPQDRLYALGMAAAEVGQTSLAVEALTSLQEHLTTRYDHYAAQSAYTLVQLLPDSEAKRYARIIATQFANTIYNNSVVQAHL